MPTKAEVTAHWTDTGRRLFLAEVKVKRIISGIFCV